MRYPGVLYACVLALPCAVAAQTPTPLHGRVVDPSGALVSAATVTPAGGAAIQTNARGEFDVAVDRTTTTLLVSAPGFQASRLALMPETHDVTIRLRLGPQSEVVNVSAENSGYVAVLSSLATKSSVELQQTPQAIAVVRRAVLEDENALSIDEILHNVGGTSGPTRLTSGLDYNGSASAAYKVRGFLAETYQDGLPYRFGTGYRDSTVNLDRVEVLKGPSAALYGGSTGAPIGGLISIDSQRPAAERRYAVNLRGGSFQFLNPSVDLNQPITADGRLAARLTAEYESADTFVNYFHRQGWAINPSVSWTGQQGSLTLLGSYSDLKQPDYNGLPTTGTLTGNFRIPDSFSFSGPLAPQTDSSLGYLSALAQHAFSKAWSLDTGVRYANGDLHEPAFSLFSNTPAKGTTSFTEAPVLLDQNQTEVNVNPNLHGRWSSSKLADDALIGFEFDQVNDSASIGFASLFSLDPLHPSFQQFPTTPIAPGTLQANIYTTRAGYLQDQLTIAKRIHLQGSVRFTGLEVRANDPNAGTVYDLATERATPRVGAVVDVPPSGQPVRRLRHRLSAPGEHSERHDAGAGDFGSD